MRDLRFSVYKNVWGKKCEIISKTWEEWIKELSVHITLGKPEDTSSERALNEAKLYAPALIFGSVDGLRKRDNVLYIDALSLDVEDHSEKTVNASLAPLSDYEWFAYSTHKHGSEVAQGLPRLRIIVPLAKTLPAADYFRAWDGLDDLTSHISDKSVRDLARLNFYPSTFNPGLAVILHRNEGQWMGTEALFSKIATHNHPSSQVDDIDLERLVRILEKVRKKDNLKEASKALLKGDRFAENGNRHNTIRDLTFRLAQKHATISKEVLEKLFLPSLKAMDIADRFSEVWTAYQGAVEKIVEVKTGGNQNIYSQKQIESIARTQKCTVGELEHRWIVQLNGGGWLLEKDGNYAGPFTKFDFQTAINIYLKNAPIEKVDITSQGVKLKKLSDLVTSNGDIVEHLQADATIQVSHFDLLSKTFFEAVTPLRADLRPVHDLEIAHWLELLAGDYYEKLIDFLSVVPDLSLSLCALYFSGTKGSGKTLFVQGISKLWTKGGPATLSQVFSKFNSALAECPIIFADEYIPTTFRKEPVTEKLREIIGSSSRPLTRKFHPDTTLIGQIRLILAANHEFLLQDSQMYSQEDRAAIAQRFLHIPVGPAPAEYLESIPRERKRQWLEKGIAEYVLWLHENHKVRNPGKRFTVDGDAVFIDQMLLTSGDLSATVCEWLVRYLDNPHLYETQSEGGYVRVYEGELLCNPQAITDHLTVYLKHSKETLKTARVGQVLTSLAKSKKPRQLRFRGKQIRYKRIDVEPLFQWSDRNGVGTREQMEATLRGENIEEDEEAVREEWEGNGEYKYDA